MRIFIVGLLALGLITPISASAGSAPKVVVTVPALHSLVSNLLDGVARPELLFHNGRELKADNLTGDQKNLLNNADMLVWVGPKFESAMTGYRLQHPTLTRKEITLGDTLPLFHKPTLEKLAHSDKLGDMKFWLDPKLAKIAVSRLSHSLVTLFPDQLEQILDNEIVLKGKLMKLETTMRDALGNDKSVPLDLPQSDILYLAWRFNLENPTCKAAAQKQNGFDRTLGSNHYFDLMGDILKDLQVCQRKMA